jgi:hypothetical protein
MSALEGLLRILLPNGGYVMQIVDFYLDESESPDPPIMCVAGYLFKKEASIIFDNELAELLHKNGLPYFRMVDCAHGNGVFDGWDVGERDTVAREVIEMIKRYASQGCAISFNLNDASFLPGAKAIGIDIISPYSFACFALLSAAKRWAERNSYHGRIAYFFESGHTYHSESNRIMNAIFSDDWSREFFMYSSHSFVDKREVRQVQAADLLAWQWRKNRKDWLEGNKRMRLDLQSLIQVPHNVKHFSEPELRTLLSEMAKKHAASPQSAASPS